MTAISDVTAVPPGASRQHGVTSPSSSAGAFATALALAAALGHPAANLPSSSPGAPPSVTPPTITLGAAIGMAPLRPIPAAGLGVIGSASAASGISGMDGNAGAAASGGTWKAKLPAAGRVWADAIEAAAGRHGVDPRLLAALVRAESGFRPQARSSAGAIGLAQLMPATARGLGVDPYDPAANLDGGARYLRDMQRRFGSDALALAAYNAGPGRVERSGGIPNIPETRAYVARVLRFYQELQVSS